MASLTSSFWIGVSALALEIALQVSGYQNVYLAIVLGVIAVGGFAYAVFLYVTGRRGPETPSTREEYDLSGWTNHAVYKVWVAACLWADTKPRPNIPSESVAYPSLQKIKAAIFMRKINVLKGDGGMTSEVTREEPFKLADSLGERPRFLYPNG